MAYILFKIGAIDKILNIILEWTVELIIRRLKILIKHHYQQYQKEHNYRSHELKVYIDII